VIQLVVRRGLPLEVDPVDLVGRGRHDLDGHEPAAQMEVGGLEDLRLTANATGIRDLGVPAGDQTRHPRPF
jgi:hypothetical protein